MKIEIKKAEVLLVLLLLLGVALPSIAMAHTAEDPFVTDLIAGGGNPNSQIDVGDILVWNDADYLYVKYITTDGWTLAETHLAVATSLDGIPQTKKGNPIPGMFEYSTVHDPTTTTEYLYTIPQTWDVHATLYIAAHAEVLKLIGSCTTWQWATDVVDYKQGTLVGGGPITDPARIDPTKALDAPDGVFYSLGFVSNDDGYIVLGFGYPIYNGPTPDIKTIEITWGRPSYPDESADVFVWPKDGTDWAYAGSVSNHDNPDGSSYVTIPDGITYVEKVKLVDATNKQNFPDPPYGNADGFDLDAVGAHYLLMAEETAWGDGEGFQGKNWATYITYGWQWTERWPETGTAYIGYEDWTGGDFDYNDFGMSMVVTEIRSISGIHEIDITCQALVKLAGWHHMIHLYWTDGVTGHGHLEEWDATETNLIRTYDGDITGEVDVVVFDDTGTDKGHITKVHITFDEPVTTGMSPPYDPYIWVYNTGLEYHIGDTQPKVTPAGSANLPYILVVPVTWLPPAESQSIWTVYGYFDNYYVNGGFYIDGEWHEDWYNYKTGPNPTVPYVPYP